MLVFYLENYKTLFLGLSYLTSTDKETYQFWLKPWTNANLEKCQFAKFFNSMFLYSRNASFLCRTLPHTFFGVFYLKR